MCEPVRSLNHEYIAGSHIWITVSGHSTVILIGFIIRRCVNQTTARSLNPEPNLVHRSGHITVILRRFITGRCVNQTTARSLNHEYTAGSHIWITVSGHSRVILRRFIIRRCVKRITAGSLNHTSKSISQKVYNQTMCKPGYSQVTKS